MKKTVVLATFLLAAFAAGWFVFRTISAGNASARANTEVSPRSAAMLQTKIDGIKKAHADGDPGRPAEQIEVYEAELESYVLYSLRDDIPVQIDSIDVQLSPETIASDTQVTFNQTTGNAMIDALVGGTHSLFLKGKLAGANGMGKFELEEIRVDGIPMPRVLIETLFKKYVKPKYPDADLSEPFDLPWGIENITIEQGKAGIVY